MNAPELLDRLHTLDVRVSLDGDRLAIDAPREIWTADLRAQVTAEKSEIIAVLRGREKDVEPCASASFGVPAVGGLPSTCLFSWKPRSYRGCAHR